MDSCRSRTSGRPREEWLRKILDLQNGIPSHDTIGRVFSMLSPEAFCQLHAVGGDSRRSWWTTKWSPSTARPFVGARTGRATEAPSTWSTPGPRRTGWCSGRYRRARSQRDLAIPELVAALELKGCIVTIDAMGCQKSIAAVIIKAEADYVLALKDNHPTLHQEVQGFFEDGVLTDFDGIQHDFHESPPRPTTATRCGRSGHRASSTGCRSRRLGGHEEPRLRRSPPHGPRQGHLGPPALLPLQHPRPRRPRGRAHRRAHWQIENGLHWVLDIAFREDEARARKGHAAENLATVRSIALNLLKQETSSKRASRPRGWARGWDHRYLLKILGD